MEADAAEMTEVHSQGTKRRLTPQQMELEKLQHEARVGVQKQQAECSSLQRALLSVPPPDDRRW